MARGRTSPGKAAAGRTPLLEWLVAGLGLVFVLAAFGLVLYDAVRSTDAPPQVVVEPKRIAHGQGGWLVEFEARNPTHSAAAEVQVSGVIVQDGQEIERRSVLIDYVPGRSHWDGALQFQKDPRGRLELAADGYRRP